MDFPNNHLLCKGNHSYRPICYTVLSKGGFSLQCHIQKMGDNAILRNRLLWLRQVNRFVAGHQSSDDGAPHQAQNRADFGSLGRLN